MTKSHNLESPAFPFSKFYSNFICFASKVAENKKLDYQIIQTILLSLSKTANFCTLTGLATKKQTLFHPIILSRGILSVSINFTL